MALFKKSASVPKEVKKEIQHQTRDVYQTLLEEDPTNPVLPDLRHDLAENRRGKKGLRAVEGQTKSPPFTYSSGHER